MSGEVPLSTAKSERRRPVPASIAPYAFRPGQSGNPGGKGGLYQETVRLAREAAPDAVRRLIEISKSDDERIAGYAANAILERAWGKPKEYDPKLDEQQGPMNFDPSRIPPELLPEVKRALMVLISASAPPEER